MENITTERFRGWANYFTFKVFDDTLSMIDFDDKVSAEDVRKIALQNLFLGYEIKNGSHRVEEYAKMMMELVDFDDIAETINLDIKNIK